jgi:hypothetical protein
VKIVGRRYVCSDYTLVNLDQVEMVKDHGDYLTIYFGSGKMVSTDKEKLQGWIDIIEKMEGNNVK